MTGRLVVMLALPGLLISCVSVTVEPLTKQVYPARSGDASVSVLHDEPARPHIRLARIIATSQSVAEDTLQDRILDRARELGADAVVLERTDVIESMGAGPLYSSTMGPAGDAYTSSTWGPWGWWSPFYLDPWSYAQGDADQIKWVLYCSGIAIRYEGTVGTATPREF